MLQRLVLGLCAAALCARAGVVMEVFPSPAPNAFGSPSWNQYVTNAIFALENNLSTVGDPLTDPAAYYRVDGATDMSNIVTGFPSWNGSAAPATDFGPAFANELGNRLHFGLAIVATGDTTFSLSGLSFDMESSDVGRIFQFVGDYSTPSDTYSSRRVGIAPDGSTIDSGAANQVVKALYLVGAGNALAPDDVSCPGTSQAAINCVKGEYDALLPLSLTTTYTLRDINNNLLGTASATVDFTETPEPSSMGLLIVGVPVVLFAMRRMAR